MQLMIETPMDNNVAILGECVAAGLRAIWQAFEEAAYG